MKFVHIADMHFDTSFAQINNSDLGNSRRLEQRKALKKVIEYIKEHAIDYLFISGDLYENGYIDNVSEVNVVGCQYTQYKISQGISITLKGIEYLTDNTFIEKAKRFFK